MSDLVEKVARAKYDALPWLDSRDKLLTWEELDPQDRQSLCAEIIPAITATLEVMMEDADSYGLAVRQLKGLIEDFARANGITLKGEKG